MIRLLNKQALEPLKIGDMRNSFIFYRSFYEAIKDLPRDIQGEIYTAIMEYGLNGNETENLKPVARSIFTLIKPNLQANIARYENGKKGGRPKKDEEKPKENLTETNVKPDKDKDKDKDVDKEFIDFNTEKKEPSPRKIVEKINYQEIVDYFNQTLSPPLPKVVVVSDARKKAIKLRVDEHGIEAVRQVFSNVASSKFLKGESENGWKCYFDWIFNPRNFIKILEGNYADNRTIGSEKQRANDYAMQQYINDRIAREQGVADEVEKPF